MQISIWFRGKSGYDCALQAAAGKVVINPVVVNQVIGVTELERGTRFDGQAQIGSAIDRSEPERHERRTQPLPFAQREVGDGGDHRPDRPAVTSGATTSPTQKRPEMPLLLALNGSKQSQERTHGLPRAARLVTASPGTLRTGRHFGRSLAPLS